MLYLLIPSIGTSSDAGWWTVADTRSSFSWLVRKWLILAIVMEVLSKSGSKLSVLVCLFEELLKSSGSSSHAKGFLAGYRGLLLLSQITILVRAC